jgi:hypothetical protein
VAEALVVLLSVPTGFPSTACRLHITDWFAVMLTVWAASMVGLEVGEVNCSPVLVVVVVVVLAVFPPPQLANNIQRTTPTPAR